MLRRISASVVALFAAASLVLAGAAPAMAGPSVNTNAPAYWQTPGTSEVCANLDEPGGSTWTLPAPPSGSTWTKVVLKAGNAGTSVEFENNAYYSDPTYKSPAGAPGTNWVQVGNLQSTTFSTYSGKDISHVIYCWAPLPLIEVAGGAATSNETCQQDALVGGVITVELKTGVSYSITGPSGAVAFDPVTGMTAPLPPGSYSVAVSATSGYVLTGASTIPLTIAPYGDDCGDDDPVQVTPSATVVDQTCLSGVLLKGGSLTVGPDLGITYTITGPSGAVPFDAITRTTGELPPGTYTVHPVAQPGFVLSSAADLVRVVGAYDGECGLITHPDVDAAATQTQLTCFTNGSYMLSDNQPGFAATVWTVNGAPATLGTYSVTAPGVYEVHVDPAPGFGFTAGQITDWTFTFAASGGCDLTTLAITGSSGSAWYAAFAAGLGLLGAALIRRAGRAGRRAA